MRKAPNGENLFRERFYHLLTKNEEDYWSLLERHFEKHLRSLGGERWKGYTKRRSTNFEA